MKIPRKLLIKGKEWKITWVKEIPGDSDETVFGVANTANRTIQMSKKTPVSERQYIFMHEYFHALLFEIGVSGNTGGISDLAEEIICDDFADFMTNEIEWKWKRRKK